MVLIIGLTLAALVGALLIITRAGERDGICKYDHKND